MSLDLSQFTTTDSGIYVPTPRARVNTIPWDDLQALDPSDTYQRVNQDLQATLSNMVGQSALGPRMIASNFRGAARTDANINPTSIVTRGGAQGTTVIQVDDVSQFAESAQAFITNGFSNPNLYGYITGIAEINFDTKELTVQVGTPQALMVGDIVQSIPITFVIPQAGFWKNEVLKVQPFLNVWFQRSTFTIGTPSITSLIAPSNSETLEYFSASIRCPVGTSYNGLCTLSNAGNQIILEELACEGPNPIVGIDFAPGGGPRHSANAPYTQGVTVTLNIPAGGAGVNTVLDSFMFSILNGTGAAITPVARIWLGASGTTQAFNSPMAALNNAADRVGLSKYGLYNPTANQAITLDFDRNAVNLFEAISATYHYTLASQPMSMARVSMSGLKISGSVGGTWTLALSNPVPSGAEVALSMGGNSPD